MTFTSFYLSKGLVKKFALSQHKTIKISITKIMTRVKTVRTLYKVPRRSSQFSHILSQALVRWGLIHSYLIYHYISYHFKDIPISTSMDRNWKSSKAKSKFMSNPSLWYTMESRGLVKIPRWLPVYFFYDYLLIFSRADTYDKESANGSIWF